MMLKMTEKSREFLERYAPEVLETEDPREAEIRLGRFIDEHGFEPPDYYDYNDLGREAQKVYDDIYYSN